MNECWRVMSGQVSDVDCWLRFAVMNNPLFRDNDSNSNDARRGWPTRTERHPRGGPSFLFRMDRMVGWQKPTARKSPRVHGSYSAATANKLSVAGVIRF